MITGMVVFALGAFAQQGQEPRCDLYWERRHGDYQGGRLYTTYCRSPAIEREPFTLLVGARWEGPGGEVVRSEVLATESCTIEDRGLTEEGWSFEAVKLEGPSLGEPSWTRYRATFDPVSRTFTPAVQLSAEGWQERQQRMVDERIARGDRVVVAGLVGQPSPGDMAWYDGTLSHARAVRDAALADHRAGRSRDGADRVLALFAFRSEDKPRQGLERQGKEIVMPLVGRLWLDPAQPEVQQILRDLALVLDEGGEYTAAAALYGVVAAAGGGSRPGMPPAGGPTGDLDASMRFLQALEEGDLERALGAATAGGFSARARKEWWLTGAEELLNRKERGDLDAIPPLLRFLGDMPDGQLDPELETALKPAVLALSGVDGASVWTWISEPDDPEELVARSRMSRSGAEPLLLEKALEMAGAKAVISIGVMAGDLCAVVSGGPQEKRVLCGRKDTKAQPEALENIDPKLEMPRCSFAAWPCFAPTQKVSTEGGYHRCGVDALGQPWCTGSGSLAQLEPPAGGGYTLVVAGNAHACALHSDHHVACWGDNQKGQAPRRIDQVVDVAAYGDWTCVLDLDGKVSCKGKRAPHLSGLPQKPAFLQDEDYARLVR